MRARARTITRVDPATRDRIIARDSGRCTWFQSGVRCAVRAVHAVPLGDTDDISDERLTARCSGHRASHGPDSVTPDFGDAA